MSTTELEQAESFNTAIADQVPEIAKPETTTVPLVRGLVNVSTGDWQATAEVRELTGADEEYLARIEAKQNVSYADYMSALLRRGTVSIGSIQVDKDPSVLDHLIIGDRDALFLGIIKATYGPERTFITRCGNCEQKNDITINLEDDFKYDVPAVDVRKPIPVTLKNGSVVHLRLPTGADTTQIATKATNSANQSTMLIARCSVWDDATRPANLEEWARNLSVVDRNTIVRTLSDLNVGPKIGEVNVQCAHCQESIEIRIDWISLLLG